MKCDDGKILFMRQSKNFDYDTAGKHFDWNTRDIQLRHFNYIIDNRDFKSIISIVEIYRLYPALVRTYCNHFLNLVVNGSVLKFIPTSSHCEIGASFCKLKIMGHLVLLSII